jgi:hypothetical protein
LLKEVLDELLETWKYTIKIPHWSGSRSVVYPRIAHTSEGFLWEAIQINWLEEKLTNDATKYVHHQNNPK